MKDDQLMGFAGSGARRGRSRIPLVTFLATLAGGCGGVDGEAVGGEQQEISAAGPEEIVLEGRAFVRLDTVSVDERAVYRDGASAYEEGSREWLAYAFRDVAMSEEYGGVYLERDPNFALADEIIANDAKLARGEAVESDPSPPREYRQIVGGSDGRTSVSRAWPNSPIGRISTGCSSVLVTANRAYTAAHCVYDNRTDDTPSQQGWICNDGTLNLSGCTLGSYNFNSSGVVTCSKTTYVPSAWVDHTDGVLRDPETESDYWKRARWDRAKVVFSCSPGSTDGYLGTTVLPNPSGFSSYAGWVVGYPSRVPCPDGSGGTSVDCPNGTLQQGGATPNLFSGYGLFAPGVLQPSYTWNAVIDSTAGNSGGPVLENSYYVVGVAVNQNGDYNKANRIESTVSTWLFN
jgi:V8-like Glu-specific endopeptidase